MRRMKVTPRKGWILVAADENRDGKRIPGAWYVCSDDIFDTQTKALNFVRDNYWSGTYRAIRGQIGASRAR